MFDLRLPRHLLSCDKLAKLSRDKQINKQTNVSVDFKVIIGIHPNYIILYLKSISNFFLFFCAGMAVYNVVIVCVVGVPTVLFFQAKQHNVYFIVTAICITSCTTTTLLLVFIPKVSISIKQCTKCLHFDWLQAVRFHLNHSVKSLNHVPIGLLYIPYCFLTNQYTAAMRASKNDGNIKCERAPNMEKSAKKTVVRFYNYLDHFN